MGAKQISEHLDTLVFFSDFTAEEKAEVISFTLNFVSFREGDLIVQQDSNDPSLYIILDGEVELRKNEQPDVIISTLSTGSIFGTIPALRTSPRNKNVIAVKKSLILRLDRPMLDELNPAVINKFDVEFIKVLFRRVAEMNVKVAHERGEIGGIANAYGKIKDTLDKIPSLPEETRITSNLIYERLKNIQGPTE
ncbi:MAG: cyclic nucleotide-binding domain-containing protein [Nitrospina sp.]|jgi:CRP-like cAMP-binding protein|nr:cyclic nucleotide-binding domain-containing protein [Nitrospina sp.]MBT3415007.1 cyclic nucleotide-binding domain-containing protein [Nitrospina sp.]MBT3856029.1 cyclic nucleotide-binding domain-containing protein [Nitrospina sp.]MBT4103637.1 cyclic nucleotide-binding domain-containing protein [Nitrospina sp.]MBT4389817.1 cyclic nucleotide-binding domain-containing protein [Nitrospina sp.]